MFLSCLNGVDTHLVHFKSLLCKGFNFSLLFELLLSSKLSHSDLISVSFHDVRLNTSSFLLSLKLTNLLTLQVLLGLALNELTFQHLFFQLFNIVDFEFFKLVGDGLRVLHLLVIFTFEFSTHFSIVLLHLLLLKLFPIAFDFLSDGSFTSFVGFLSILLFHNIRNEHL